MWDLVLTMRYAKLISGGEVKKEEHIDMERNNSRRYPDLRGFAAVHRLRPILSIIIR